MVSFVSSMWIAAALAQSPSAAPETAFLKSVPAEAEVVIRVRAPKAVRDDLASMVQAMSPNMGPMAGPALDNGLALFSQRFGADAPNLPFVIVARLPKNGDNGPPPYAVMIQAKDYAAVQKQLGPDGKPEPQGGGIDKVTGADGQPLFTYKGSNYVAFGNSKEVLTSLTKPTKTLDTALTPELRDRFFGGDAGVYVNLAAIQARYGDQIEQARKDMLDRVEKGVANQGGNQNPEAAKTAINLLFKALANGDSLSAHLDFDAKGMAIGGLTAVKPGSDAAKMVAQARPGNGELLGRLPADSAFFMYSSVSPASFDRFQKLAASFMPGGGTGSPEQEKAMALAKQAGPKEVTAAANFGKGGSQSIGLSTYADPAKAVEATIAGIAALKSGKAALPDMIKDITVTRDAETYKGFTFAKSQVTYDQDKMKAMAGKTPANPNGPSPDAMRALMGDGVTTWVGTDGKTVLQVSAPDWNQAKARIDAVLAGGSSSLGQASNYQALRNALPKQFGTLILVNAQALITQGLASFGTLMPDSPVGKTQLNLPAEPAFFGGTVTPVAKGFQFQFLLPSSVGPVVEQAVGPIFQAVQGNKVDQ